jgi:ABC-type sugar transport system permease subunit
MKSFGLTRPALAWRPQQVPRHIRNEMIGSWLFVLPMLILTLTFSIYPVFRSLQITQYNWQGFGNPTQYVGMRHFETVLHDEYFWSAFKHTVQYTAVLVPVQLTLALMLALILHNPKMRLRMFYRTIYFMPVVTSVAIVAIVVRLMLQRGAVPISEFLNIRPPINPVGNPDYSMWSVIAFGTWFSFGYNLVFFMAALATVPEELYDAAKVDGANWFQRLYYVTLPGIRPIATVILFFAVLGSMQVFEQSFALTGGGPFFSSEVVAGYTYRYAFGATNAGSASTGGGQMINLGYASAAGFIMNLMVLGVTLLQLFFTRQRNRY